MRAVAVLLAAAAFLAFWITLIGAEVHAAPPLPPAPDNHGTSP